MRFRPQKGLQTVSKKQEKEAADARAEVLGEKSSEEPVFSSEIRHGQEIERAENQAVGIETPEKPAGRGRGRGVVWGTRERWREREARRW